MKIQLRSAFIIGLIGVATAIGCKKTDNTTPANNNNNTTACNGKPMCYKLDGTDVTRDSVKWRVITVSGSPDRYRIYWETGNGATYENIEIDVYGSTTGTYNISTTPAAGDAGFQYYVTNGTKDIRGVSGTVEITSIDNTNNTITGKFTVTAEDKNNGNKQYKFTDGNFVNVPK